MYMHVTYSGCKSSKWGRVITVCIVRYYTDGER